MEISQYINGSFLEGLDRKLDRILELLEKTQPPKENWKHKLVFNDGKWWKYWWNSNEPTQYYYEVADTCQ